MAVLPEDTGANGVKRSQPHLVQRPAQEPGDPLLHLVGRLVGESYRQNFLGGDSFLFDQVGNFVGEDPRFSRPRSGDDQRGPVGVAGGGLLLGIEAGEDRFHGIDRNIGQSLRFQVFVPQTRFPHSVWNHEIFLKAQDRKLSLT